MTSVFTSDRAFFVRLNYEKPRMLLFWHRQDVTFLQRQLWVVTHESDSSCTRTQTECPGGFTHRVLFVNQSKTQQKDGCSPRGSACHSLTQKPFHDAVFLYIRVCPNEFNFPHWNLLPCLDKRVKPYLITKSWESISGPQLLFSRIPELPTMAQRRWCWCFIGDTVGSSL